MSASSSVMGTSESARLFSCVPPLNSATSGPEPDSIALPSSV
jgi:hypothetical protein